MTPAPLADRLSLSTGGIVLCRCPGRDRTVAEDVACLASHGATTLLSLVEPREFPDMAGLAMAVRGSGLKWLRLPVADFRSPDVRAWAAVSPRLHDLLDRGEWLAIHCWSGLGRTGTVAARLLVERGYPLADAVALVRAARPGAIETGEQSEWVARPR